MRLTQAQVDLLKVMQANPGEYLQVYYSYSASKQRAFLTKIHFNPRMNTVNALIRLGMFEMAPGKHYGDYIYTLSEKGKSYNVN